MKNWILILLLLISCTYAWEKTWDSMHRESFTDFVQLQDGGFILVGHKGTTLPVYTGIYTTRVDSDGNTLWTRFDYAGGATDMAKGIVSIDDTTFAIVGVMESAFPDDYSYLYLSRISINGNTLWTSVCDTAFFGDAVDIAADGNIVVMDGSWPMLQKYNLSGAGVWASRFYSYPYNFIIKLWDMKSINRDSYYESGYITCGYGTRTTGSNYHAVIARFDSEGDTLWVRHYGNSEHEEFYSITNIMNPAPGYPEGFLAVGYSDSCSSKMCSGSWFIVRTDLHGDTVWTKCLSHPDYGFGEQYVNDIVWVGNETYQTKFAIAGVTTFPESLGSKTATWLVVISDTLRGDTLWTKTYDRFTDQIPNSIVLCDDGGFAIAGYAEDSVLLPYPHKMDMWLLRVDSLGNDLPYAISETAPVKPQAITLSAYPNPFNSAVNISVNGSVGEGLAPSCVEIFDIAGRRVAKLPRLASRGTPSQAKGNSPLFKEGWPKVGVFLSGNPHPPSV
ncbi:hypothetical protein KAH81_02930, partial [bacterium]|nr:hypothetical protein [bacterium]